MRVWICCSHITNHMNKQTVWETTASLLCSLMLYWKILREKEAAQNYYATATNWGGIEVKIAKYLLTTSQMTLLTDTTRFKKMMKVKEVLLQITA